MSHDSLLGFTFFANSHGEQMTLNERFQHAKPIYEIGKFGVLCPVNQCSNSRVIPISETVLRKTRNLQHKFFGRKRVNASRERVPR